MVDKTLSTKDLKVELIENGKIKVTIRTWMKGITPAQVIDFILNLNQERFHQFHPRNHKEYKVLSRPKEGLVGTIIYLKEEYDNGYISSAKAKIVEATPGQKFALKSIVPWWQPISLSGVAEATDTGTFIIHQVIAGSSLPILGFVFNRIIKIIFLSKGNLEAIYKHVKEEYRNLEKLVYDG